MKIRKLAADLHNVLSSQTTRKVFRIGNELISIAQPVLEKPTSFAFAKAALGVCMLAMSESEMWPDDYFDSSWDSPYAIEFIDIVYGVLQHMPYKTIITSDKSVEIRIITMHDDVTGRNVKIGYVYSISSNRIDRLCVPFEDVKVVRRIIKEKLWLSLRNDNVVLRQQKMKPGVDSTIIGVAVDDAFQPMPSQRAAEYSKYLKRCIDAGVGRSVMLYGPPGTGKSTMARTIVDNLGMKSFRIRVEDVGHFDTPIVFDAIDIFQPDAIILDDFDRADSQSSLLETLEFFHKKVKLIIATVNNRNALDEAILRPGRFDEMLFVKQMDEDVIKSILGPEHESAFEVVKDWPIAFIQEYIKRRRFMSADEAEISVKELAMRVKRLEDYDDPVDKMLNSPSETEGTFPKVRHRRKTKSFDIDQIFEIENVGRKRRKKS